MQSQLESILKRLQLLEQENKTASLERQKLQERIIELEDQIQDLNESVRILKGEKVQQKASKQEDFMDLQQIEINNQKKKTNSAEDEAWLFYCEKGKTTQDILKTLDFLENQAIELDASEWSSEESMWVQILSKTFTDPSEIPTKLKSLQQLVQVELSTACHNELMIIVRNIPSDQAAFQAILPHVATLAEYVNMAWSEVENNNPELLGRVAMVLESQDEIKMFSVDRKDSTTCLYVEKL